MFIARHAALGWILSVAMWSWPASSAAMDFHNLAADSEPAELQPYQARDGTTLHYREYGTGDQPDTVIVLLHGSGYHSAYLAPLATALSHRSDTRVYTPDMRGHGPSPLRRGDVNHIGQLEQDLDDFLRQVRLAHPEARLILAGHSSGGGLAIRHAGGDPATPVDGQVLLAPYIHHDAPTRADNGSDWATPKIPRLVMLSLLNGVGISALNDMTVLEFNMPDAARDGTETLSYSYRMQVSMHPRDDYRSDLEALGTTLVLVGEQDDTFRADAYSALFAEHAGQARVRVLEGIGHLGLVGAPETAAAIRAWLAETPSDQSSD